MHVHCIVFQELHSLLNALLLKKSPERYDTLYCYLKTAYFA